jgi:branched-subunit amino acid aminotransferase/4-amino-4-deoxychorismate lyase
MDGKLNLKYISKIDELFLTNSGSGIVPVTLLNGKLIGSGSVGIITQQLLSLYHNWMIQDIERKQTYE